MFQREKKQGKKIFFELKVGYSETLQVCRRRRFCKINEFSERLRPQTPGSRKILNRFGLKSLNSYCIQLSPQQIKKTKNPWNEIDSQKSKWGVQTPKNIA